MVVLTFVSNTTKFSECQRTRSKLFHLIKVYIKNDFFFKNVVFMKMFWERGCYAYFLLSIMLVWQEPNRRNVKAICSSILYKRDKVFCLMLNLDVLESKFLKDFFVARHVLHWADSSFSWKELLKTWSYRASP